MSNPSLTLRVLHAALVCGPVMFFASACERTDGTEESTASEIAAMPMVAAATPVEAGRYLISVAGCNDCHTEGYMQTDGDVPESEWLTGSTLGWRGPWGTTYPTNLRLRASELTEDAWIEQVHSRRGLPPMPWASLRNMSDPDARAIYRYLRSLGPKGEHVPAPVPPDREPTTPYLDLDPVSPAGS